ncbi:hypothetical protein JXA88_09610 [Candidatus Fermentibacteria bacterium]|nr:hypothetical protein [Candidatus Fermentibacteria bacterium]
MLLTFLKVSAERWSHLESLVSRLGTECHRLQRENVALARAVADREQEILRLRSTHQEQALVHEGVTRFLSVKEQVQERIDDLLARIDLAELPISSMADIER